MFERFTDEARNVVILAQAKAAERGDDQIRPAHMLYGLASTDGVAARALTALGLDPATAREQTLAEVRRTLRGLPGLLLR